MRNKIAIVSLLLLLMILFASCHMPHHVDRTRTILVKNYQPNYLDVEPIGVSAHTDIIIQDFFMVLTRNAFRRDFIYSNYQVVADSILADLNQVFQSNVSFDEQRDLDVIITVHSLCYQSSGFRSMGETDIEVSIYDHNRKKLIKSYRKPYEEYVKLGDDYKREYHRLSHPSHIIYQVLNQVMDEIKMNILADREIILERLSADADEESPN